MGKRASPEVQIAQGTLASQVKGEVGQAGASRVSARKQLAGERGQAAGQARTLAVLHGSEPAQEATPEMSSKLASDRCELMRRGSVLSSDRQGLSQSSRTFLVHSAHKSHWTVSAWEQGWGALPRSQEGQDRVGGVVPVCVLSIRAVRQGFWPEGPGRPWSDREPLPSPRGSLDLLGY